ncbi:MAG: alginate export family protein, partial [Sulfuricaulis sp.]|nr:alginate export family protein [Sulfuricaulis sp.]
MAGLAGILIACCPGVGQGQVQGQGQGQGQAGAGLRAALPEVPTGGVPEQDKPEGTQARGDEGLPGRALFQLRPRYTYGSQSNKPETARAENMRLLLGYRTAPIGDVAFTAQLVNVSWREPKQASNAPGTFASEYPLVADPDKSDVNLLHADYVGLPDLRIRLGRQMIKLDNERFVGSADMRQMPQAFDAISARYTGIPDTEIHAAHAWHVRTYFGNRFQTSTTLLNARVQSELGLSAGAYGYFQNQPQINNRTGFADNSNRVLGARLEGNTPSVNGLRWYYTAEAAQQRAYAHGDQQIRATYHRLALGPSWKGYSVQLNYERLGSNQGRYGFQTPLSYNTFQGWAYNFFSTPAEGVRDLNASFG